MCRLGFILALYGGRDSDVSKGMTVRQEWASQDLVVAWTLVDDDWRRIANKRRATRLGFALLLKFFELEARFPEDPDELPAVVVAYVADQVRVPADAFDGYGWSTTCPPHRLRHFCSPGSRPQGLDDALIQPYKGSGSNGAISWRLCLGSAEAGVGRPGQLEGVGGCLGSCAR